MKTSEEMTRDVFARIRANEEKKARRGRTMKRAALTLGAVCLAALTALGVSRAAKTVPAPQSAQASAETETAAQTQTTGAPAETGTEAVSQQSGAMLPFDGETAAAIPELVRGDPQGRAEKYRAPRPGHHVITLPLSEALAADDGNTNWLVRFEVMNDALAAMTPDEKKAFYLTEAARMEAGDRIDFMVATFTDENTGETRVIFGGLLRDPTFLYEFPDHPDYGYFIALYDEASGVK